MALSTAFAGYCYLMLFETDTRYFSYGGLMMFVSAMLLITLSGSTSSASYDRSSKGARAFVYFSGIAMVLGIGFAAAATVDYWPSLFPPKPTACEKKILEAMKDQKIEMLPAERTRIHAQCEAKARTSPSWCVSQVSRAFHEQLVAVDADAMASIQARCEAAHAPRR